MVAGCGFTGVCTIDCAGPKAFSTTQFHSIIRLVGILILVAALYPSNGVGLDPEDDLAPHLLPTLGKVSSLSAVSS